MKEAAEAFDGKVGRVDRRQRSRPFGMTAQLHEIEAQTGDLRAPPVKPKEDGVKRTIEFLDF